MSLLTHRLYSPLNKSVFNKHYTYVITKSSMLTSVSVRPTSLTLLIFMSYQNFFSNEKHKYPKKEINKQSISIGKIREIKAPFVNVFWMCFLFFGLKVF